MTPEQQLKFEEMTRAIETLTTRLNNLNAFATIPYDTEKAFRDRLKISTYTSLATSSKTAASETQAVSEGGASSYNVAKPMDGFREFLVGATPIYIPFYT